MVPNAVMYNTDSGRKVCRASVAIGVKEKQRLIHSLEPSTVESPVDYVVVFLGGCHVVDILGVVLSAYSFSHAYELPCVYDSHKFDESSIKMELFLITQTEEK